MAFNKRTWKGRQGTGLNKFSINGATPVTVVNQPDSITEVGDALSAGNLNDLENRIADAFDETASQEEVTDLKNAIAQTNNDVSELNNSTYTVEVTSFESGYRHSDGVLKPSANYMTSVNPIYFHKGDNVVAPSGIKYYFVRTNGTIYGDIAPLYDITFTEDIYLYVEANASNIQSASVSITRQSPIKPLITDVTLLNESLQEATDIPSAFYSGASKVALSLSGFSSKKVFISNKNLLPQFPAITDHGVTCVQNSDGSISLSGTANGTAVFQLSVNVMPNLGAGEYTLSAGNDVAIGDDITYINIGIDGSYTVIASRLDIVDSEITFTVPEGSRVTECRIRISSGTVIPSGYKIYPQLEEGSEKTEFIKHDGSILNPTSAEILADCFVGYNYICAQSGVSGTVSYTKNISGDIDALDMRVTALEAIPFLTKKLTGKKIVCFGDSLVGNFPTPTDYPSMIAEITGATVYNAGFGGCCMCDSGDTADQPRRLFTMCRLVDSIVAGDFTAQRNSGVSITYAGTSINYVPERLDMLDGIDWSDIDYITIAYGTNDWNSNYPLDNENNPLDTTTYLGAFRYSVEKLLTAYPNIKIFIITPLWRWWDTNTGMPSEIHSDYIDSNDYAKGTGYKLWQYGDALADAAKLYHIPTFNLYWSCMMTKQNRLQYFNYNDGTHPKLEGRELMAELISAQLEAIY